MKKILVTILLVTLALLNACSQSNQINELYEKAQIKELVDTFSNLADIKDAKSQGDLFLEDGKLEFQMGFDGDINNIEGREALVEAFSNTINPCKAVYHINGQSNVTFTDASLTEATGIAYCTATLVNEVNGKDIGTTNYVRYSDNYVKQNGKWYIKTRRTTFITSDTFEMNKDNVSTRDNNNSDVSNSNASNNTSSSNSGIVNINQDLSTEIGQFDLDKRLDTDYVDLLLLHQPYGKYLDAWKAMEEAVKEGKVKSIGLSNFYQDKFKEIIDIATINPAVLQIEVNPTVAQDDMIEFCKTYGTVVEAWFPLAGRGNTQILFDNDIIKDIAAIHGKSAAQIVLRWHLQHGDIAIPGSKTESHILENINIYDFSLTDEEMNRIKSIDTNAFQFPYDGNDDAEMEQRYTSRVWNFDDQE